MVCLLGARADLAHQLTLPSGWTGTSAACAGATKATPLKNAWPNWGPHSCTRKRVPLMETALIVQNCAFVALRSLRMSSASLVARKE